MRQPDAVPVLMYHSVARAADLAPQGWAQRLSTDPALMEETLALWRRSGWKTLRLEELSDWLDGRRTVPRKSLVLTLDDGYLDNWVRLHPLLRAYDASAVVFVSSEFIDPRPGRRPQDPDALGPGGLKGYLSVDEMRAMEADGSVEIGSHARTHTWWFVSDRIVDWYRPEVGATTRNSLYRFLWLNANPGRKSSVLAELHDAAIPWGTPIYEYRPALVARRFVPDPGEAEATVARVAERGGESYFHSAGWREDLEAASRRYRAGRPRTGDAETDEERRRRVSDELAGSRRALSEALGRDVRILSCPQGAMTEEVEELAAEAGYRRWTMSVWGRGRLNRPGVSARHIYRCGRGYELLPAGWGTRASALSHAIVLERYAGSRWARAATAGLTAMGKTLGLGEHDDSPS